MLIACYKQSKKLYTPKYLMQYSSCDKLHSVIISTAPVVLLLAPLLFAPLLLAPLLLAPLLLAPLLLAPLLSAPLQQCSY